jgi:hypothetical protein
MHDFGEIRSSKMRFVDQSRQWRRGMDLGPVNLEQISENMVGDIGLFFSHMRLDADVEMVIAVALAVGSRGLRNGIEQVREPEEVITIRDDPVEVHSPGFVGPSDG